MLALSIWHLFRHWFLYMLDDDARACSSRTKRVSCHDNEQHSRGADDDAGADDLQADDEHDARVDHHARAHDDAGSHTRVLSGRRRMAVAWLSITRGFLPFLQTAVLHRLLLCYVELRPAAFLFQVLQKLLP